VVSVTPRICIGINTIINWHIKFKIRIKNMNFLRSAENISLGSRSWKGLYATLWVTHARQCLGRSNKEIVSDTITSHAILGHKKTNSNNSFVWIGGKLHICYISSYPYDFKIL